MKRNTKLNQQYFVTEFNIFMQSYGAQEKINKKNLSWNIFEDTSEEVLQELENLI